MTKEEFDKIMEQVPLWRIEREVRDRRGAILCALEQHKIKTWQDALDLGANEVELRWDGKKVADGYWDGEIVDGEKTYSLWYVDREFPVDTPIEPTSIWVDEDDEGYYRIICEMRG